MGELFELVYLVQGESPNNISIVTIEETKTIYHLKGAVKNAKRPSGARRPARSLEDFDEPALEETFGNVRFTEEEPLKPRMMISEIFPEGPEDGHLLIVKPPVLELNCLVWGDTSNNIFTVTIEKTKFVNRLKKAIKKEKQNAFQHVDADQLVLLKVSIPNKLLEESLANIAFTNEEWLKPTMRLRYFY
ncbi:hypothetical protein AX17_006549 [Amanita inopinata Kibby_2008]|nr:hypothetical protein AX17_006549 [Amanita inopinata Kibby_2008]